MKGTLGHKIRAPRLLVVYQFEIHPLFLGARKGRRLTVRSPRPVPAWGEMVNAGRPRERTPRRAKRLGASLPAVAREA